MQQTIALVDDDKNILTSVSMALEAEGFKVRTYTDGTEEVDEEGDLFYWPPGHTVRADKDTDFVLFSPQHEHGAVLDHIRTKMEESA